MTVLTTAEVDAMRPGHEPWRDWEPANPATWPTVEQAIEFVQSTTPAYYEENSFDALLAAARVLARCAPRSPTVERKR